MLAPGGTLALVQYFGLAEVRASQDQDAALGAIAAVAPDIAASWQAYRDLDATLAGIGRRRGNISRAWSWLGSYDIGREYAGRLFGDVQAAVMPKLTEHTPGELGALVRTMSLPPPAIPRPAPGPGPRQLVEHEADIRGPACRYLILPVPPGCLTGEAGGDPPVGKGRGVTLVRVVNPGHHVAVTGQVLGQGGERAAGVGEAGREHDEGQAVLTPGRPGVADRVGLEPCSACPAGCR